MYEFAVNVRSREVRKVIPKYNVSTDKRIKIGKKSFPCRTLKHSQQREDKCGIQRTKAHAHNLIIL